MRLRGEAVDLVEDLSSVRLMSRSVGSMAKVMAGVGHAVIQVPSNLSRVESHLGDLEASLHRGVQGIMEPSMNNQLEVWVASQLVMLVRRERGLQQLVAEALQEPGHEVVQS